MSKKAELEDVKTQLRRAAATGKPLDLGSSNPSENDPSLGNAWDNARALPARLIAELAASAQDRDQLAGTIHVKGARIVGSLLLNGMHISRAICLEGCHFAEPVSLREAEMTSMRLPGSYLAEGIDARNLRVRGSLELNAGFKSMGPVLLTGTDIGGDLVCAGGEFINPDHFALTLNAAVVRGAVVFMNEFRANGEVLMDGAQIGSQLLCGDGSFSNPGETALSADRISVGGSVHCSSGFTADGEVRMLGASINGPLVCTGGHFKEGKDGHALSADRASILGGVYCATGFVALGEVRLPGSRIGNQLTCSGGHFLNPGGTAVFLEGANINGSVAFDDGFIAEGVSIIRAVNIEGMVSFTNGRFVNPDEIAILLDGSTIKRSVYFRKGFVSEGTVNLSGTRIDGQLIFRGEISTKNVGLDLESVRVAKDLYLTPLKPLNGWIDCTNAQVGHFHDNKNARCGDYELSGLQYETVRGTPEPTKEKVRWWKLNPVLKRRLSWLAGNRSGYQPQIYDQLARVYGNAGNISFRRRVLIEKQRKRRSLLSLPGKAWNLAEDVLVGFGYRTWLAIIPFVALLVFGVFFFDEHRHDVVPKNGELQSPDYHPLTYTLDLLVPVVTLGLRENYVARNLAQTISTIYIIVGWILTTAIIAAMTGLVRRSD